MTQIPGTWFRGCWLPGKQPGRASTIYFQSSVSGHHTPVFNQETLEKYLGDFMRHLVGDINFQLGDIFSISRRFFVMPGINQRNQEILFFIQEIFSLIRGVQSKVLGKFNYIQESFGRFMKKIGDFKKYFQLQPLTTFSGREP